MATEKNPFEQIPQEISNVVPMAPVEETNIDATFQVEDDGGVTVDFATEETLMKERLKKLYGRDIFV